MSVQVLGQPAGRLKYTGCERLCIDVAKRLRSLGDLQDRLLVIRSDLGDHLQLLLQIHMRDPATAHRLSGQGPMVHNRGIVTVDIAEVALFEYDLLLLLQLRHH